MALGKLSVLSLIVLAAIMSVSAETVKQRQERIEKFFTRQEDKFHAELRLRLDRKATALREPQQKSLITTDPNDIAALHALYSSTDGKNWVNNTGWLKGDPCGNPFWYGIYCRDGHVLQINIVANGLSGPIPAELAKASHLQVVRLYSNLLTGTIPQEIFTMQELQIFDVNTNQITGGLPSPINMANLTDLVLYGNMMKGLFPSINAPLFSVLEVSSNSFTGPLPLLSRTKPGNPTDIVVSRNSFTGSLPATWGAFSSLTRVWTFQNSMYKPTFPGSWQGMDSLQEIQADNMYGDMPNFYNNMRNLQVFVVINGQLTGNFPNSVCDATNLNNFRIFNNSMSGEIPRCICTLRKLTDFEVSDNRFNGPVPDCIGDVTSLINLYFSRNNFSGELPPSIGSLVNLETLDVSQNDMYGTIPSSINNLNQEIAEFAICFNKFSQIDNGLQDFFNRIKDFGCAFYNNPWSCPLPSEVPKECDAQCSQCNSGPGKGDCSSCVKQNNCGWCSEGGNCLEGQESGPQDFYNCDKNDWAYGPNASC